jgi:putative spermidine/putrescine transport system ATP-binding protein
MGGRLLEIGPSEAVYRRPPSPEVAAFLGFRNRIEGRIASALPISDGSPIPVIIEGTHMEATAVAPLSSDAVTVMLRPSDVHPVREDHAGIPATVETIAFQGDAYAGSARTASGNRLQFTAPVAYAAGSSIRLAADPSRMVIYHRAK